MYEYTCAKNPVKAVEVANRFSNVPIRTPQEATKVFVFVMQNSNQETKSKLLENLREIHPDSDLYRDENGKGFWQIDNEASRPFLVPDQLAVKPAIPAEKKVELSLADATQMQQLFKTYNSCGCQSCAKMYNVTGSTEGKATDATNESKRMIFNVIVAAAIVVILYKLFVTKP